MVDTLRIDDDTKRLLTNLKRRTGIPHWNILSRWCFCASLASGRIVTESQSRSVSNVEMSWKVFSGANARLYEALAIQSHVAGRRSGFKGTINDTISEHIRSGASILLANSGNSIESLLAEAANISG